MAGDYRTDTLQSTVDDGRNRDSTGVALQKKFKLLRLAYICLTVGVVATIISFLLMKGG